MYCICYNVIYSVTTEVRGWQFDRRKYNRLKVVTTWLNRFRAYDDMYCLIDKYAPFPKGAGPARLSLSERATLSAEPDHTKL